MHILHIVKIDIIEEILIRRDALDTYLGEETRLFLQEKIDSVAKPSLVIVDIRKANPIDYLFTKVAFFEVFQKIKDDPNLDIIFFLRKSQRNSLFWGLTPPGISGEGPHEPKFLENNHIKICCESDGIQFLGPLQDTEKTVLELVNQRRELRDTEIYDLLRHGARYEKIGAAIRALVNKKLVYWDEQTPEAKIYSIQSKID